MRWHDIVLIVANRRARVHAILQNQASHYINTHEIGYFSYFYLVSTSMVNRGVKKSGFFIVDISFLCMACM